MSQNNQVLEYLKRHGSITAADAVDLDIYRLGARIYDLRARGHNIHTQMIRQRAPKQGRYARYTYWSKK